MDVEGEYFVKDGQMEDLMEEFMIECGSKNDRDSGEQDDMMDDDRQLIHNALQDFTRSTDTEPEHTKRENSHSEPCTNPRLDLANTFQQCSPLTMKFTTSVSVIIINICIRSICTCKMPVLLHMYIKIHFLYFCLCFFPVATLYITSSPLFTSRIYDESLYLYYDEFYNPLCLRAVASIQIYSHIY